MQKIKALYQHFTRDDLRRSSLLLIISQAINAGAAFIFWVLCARLFKAEDVGLATAFVSFSVLAATFTHLGLPTTVLRFLPASKHQGRLFAASFGLVALTSLLGSIAAIALIGMIAPKLSFVQQSVVLSLILAALVVGNALAALVDSTLTAFKKSHFVLRKAIISNLPRLVLPFLVVPFGIKGMAGTAAAVLLLAVLYGAVVIWRKLLAGQAKQPDISELRTHRGFASANYFGSMVGVLPSTLTPIIILQALGPVEAAFFYMPLQLAAFLNIISSSTSAALIAEAAHEPDPAAHKTHLRNAAIHLYQFLVPVATLLAISGWLILRVYGADYAAHGIWPLVIFCAASLFVAANWLGDTWLNIQRRGQAYFLMNACNAVLVVGGVWLFAKHGLAYAALGWLLGQAASALIYFVVFVRKSLAWSSLAKQTD